MKLGLGTVQFGQAYGVSNSRGHVPPGEAAAILALARDAGITTLDTAANYGEAEKVLAALDTGSFRIVTKTIGLGQGLDAVIARARQSAQALKADTLLVHAAGDLLGPDGDALWKALLELREQGVFRKIGISAYVADDPAALAQRFRPDVMQIPFSLLDQRLLADGSLARLKNLGVEIHARSLFLQGLLFLAPDALPEKLQSAAPQLRAAGKIAAPAPRRWPRRWASRWHARKSMSPWLASRLATSWEKSWRRKSPCPRWTGGPVPWRMKRCLRRRSGKRAHDAAHIDLGHRRKHGQSQNMPGSLFRHRRQRPCSRARE